MSDLKTVLEQARVLRDLGHEELIALGESLELRRLSDGETVFRTGDEATELLLVAEGALRLERAGTPLGSLASGEMLGGASLVAIGHRECDAIAEGEARLLALSRESYLRMRGDFPTVALALQEGVLRELAQVLRGALEQAAESVAGS